MVRTCLPLNQKLEILIHSTYVRADFCHQPWFSAAFSTCGCAKLVSSSHRTVNSAYNFPVLVERC